MKKLTVQEMAAHDGGFLGLPDWVGCALAIAGAGLAIAGGIATGGALAIVGAAVGGIGGVVGAC